MFQEFRTFLARGNVLDLAVAVVIGTAFGAIVTSFTQDLLMPVIGLLTGGIDLSSNFFVLGNIPATYRGSPNDYAALKAAGVPLFGFGAFVTAVINFLIVGFAVFLLVKAANKAMRPAAVVPPGPTPSEVLLAEIRDELKSRKP
ncbi:large-conductance mechanosensitive channel [Polymorphobacter glacialis]|uniref:Large-conductance mechanosensitive channel n=1 Tax=Sandarakinorhabdus glacialis TaxID=1614636 RepID=A0A916ZZL2_9SPHN|nr:large conductance mechanosensitive channel protein MscL [Polymorphobacter glacialis]GGE18239.1 large-conductance mechanosensitive channel [Polymorphobacter glacialis]